MWKQKPRSAKEIGLTRSESLQKKGGNKKEKSSKMCDKKKGNCSKVYDNTKYTRSSLVVFSSKSFNCI
jgi:hypothetical protein